MELAVASFSGGITDEVVGSQPNRYVRADNLLVNREEKLFSRPGSALLDSDHPQVVAQEIGGFVNFQNDTDLFAVSGTKVFHKGTTWDELTGASGNSAFPGAVASDRYNSAEWKGHIFLTSSSLDKPVKVYKNGGGTWKITQAGMLAYTVPAAYSGAVPNNFVSLANGIRTKLLAHFARTGAGAHAAADAEATAGLTLGALSNGCSFSALTDLIAQMVYTYGLHISDANKPAGGIYHTKSVDLYSGMGVPLDTTATPTTLTEAALLLNDLKLKFNWHARGFRQHDGTDVISTSSITSTEEGPLFNGGMAYPINGLPYGTTANAGLQGIIDTYNTLKVALNAHFADNALHRTSGSLFGYGELTFADLLDTENTITLADATDWDSARELACHCLMAYQNHQKDSAYTVYRVTGTTNSGFEPLNQVMNVVTSATSPSGDPGDIQTGMYIAPAAAGTDNFSRGTKVLTLGVTYGGGSGTTRYYFFNMSTSYAAGSVETKDFYFSKMRFHPATSWQGALTAATVSGFTNDGVVSDFGTCYALIWDLSAKLNAHATDTHSHGVGGLAPTGGSPSTSASSLPKTLSRSQYKYTFVWMNSYTLSTGQVFEDRGAIYSKIRTSWATVAEVPTSISGIATKTNGASENYPTDTMRVEIYRTINGGVTSYLVGSVSNGTTTFIDSVSDEELVTRQQLYTEGGVPERNEPPKAKFVHIVNNFGYFGNIIDESGVAVPNRIRQSFNDSISGAPGDFFVDLPLPVAGISSARELPMAFTASGVYRLSGGFSETGSGSIDAVPVSENIGLMASHSLVKIEEGLVFAGTDGFYFTDGYRLTKLTKHWNATYQTLISTAAKQGNLTGAYDKKNRRVYWAVTTTGTVNNKVFVLDLEWGLKEDSCFTTLSGGASFNPTAVCFWQGAFVRGHDHGYVFSHDASLLSDPVVDVGTSTANWITQPIIYDYLSPASDGGTTTVKKQAGTMFLQFNNVGDASIQPYFVDDLGRVQKNLTPIQYRGGSIWSDPILPGGEPVGTVALAGGSIDEKRHFPGRSLHYTYRQVGLTNAEVVVANSDTYGFGTLDKTNLQLTLGSAFTLPTGIEGMYLSLENDFYVLRFPIVWTDPLSVGDKTKTFTVTDAGGLLPPSGTYQWVIRGKPKDERFQLLSYSMPFITFGQSEVDAGGQGGK